MYLTELKAPRTYTQICRLLLEPESVENAAARPPVSFFFFSPPSQLINDSSWGVSLVPTLSLAVWVGKGKECEV